MAKKNQENVTEWELAYREVLEINRYYNEITMSTLAEIIGLGNNISGYHEAVFKVVTLTL